MRRIIKIASPTYYFIVMISIMSIMNQPGKRIIYHVMDNNIVEKDRIQIMKKFHISRDIL